MDGAGPAFGGLDLSICEYVTFTVNRISNIIFKYFI